jgi:integrase
VEGLQLEVKDSGARSWILRKVMAGKRRLMGLGGYPAVSLEEARDKAREICKRVQAQPELRLITPTEQRQALAIAVRNAMTFDEASAACHKAKAPEFSNPKHAAQWISTLTTYASPIIGGMPVDKLATADILAVLQPIWHTKTETATRVRGRIETVLNWATVSGHRPQDAANPARWSGRLDQLLPKPNKLKSVEHHAALKYTDMPWLMGLLRAKQTVSARALELAILTAARSSDVRHLTWRELDLKAKLWTVPAERMKARREHKVPLPAAAVSMLKGMGEGKPGALVFSNGDGKPLSDMTLSKLLKDMKIDCVPHGFRSTFKTWCQEVIGPRYTDEASELALAHVNDDKTRAAYARGQLLAERAKLMTEWAEYIEGKP